MMKKLLSLIIIVYFSIPFSYGQVLKRYRPGIWQASSDFVTQSGKFIGNYELHDAFPGVISDDLSKLASERYGTLFMVVRADSGSASKLFQAGSVKLYRDSILVDGLNVHTSPLGYSASVLTIQYQTAGSDGRYRRPVVDVSDTLQIAEIMYFRTRLPARQVRIVESYLAMKYSVNLSKNTDKTKRNYIDVENDDVWQDAVDGDFNGDILALGRFDSIGFYQTQTLSSDSRRLCFGFSMDSLGSMPYHVIQDASLVLLCRRGDSVADAFCEGSVDQYSWKLKFFRYSGLPDTLFLSLDTLLPAGLDVVLTDGDYEESVLLTHIPNQRTLLQIPVPSSPNGRDHYLRFGGSDTVCDSTADVYPLECHSSEGHAFAIQIQDTSHLPVHLELIHTQEGVLYDTLWSGSGFFTDALPDGQYRVKISGLDYVLYDKLHVFDDCDNYHARTSGDDPSDLLLTGFEELLTDQDSTLGASDVSVPLESPRVVLYPNPSMRDIDVSFFNLLEDVELVIVDASGAILHAGLFVPTVENSTFRYAFDTPGVYFIHCTSGGFVTTKKVTITH